MRLLDLISRQRVTVEVGGDVIVVRIAGHPFSITYKKTGRGARLSGQLVSCAKSLDQTRKFPFPKFLSLAWTAANEKARELGWI